MELKKRLEKIDFLAEKLDGVVLFNKDMGNDANFFYFTNSDVTGIFYYDFNKTALITNVMEAGRAKKSWVKNVITGRDFIEKMKGKRIGIDKKSLDVATFERLRKNKMVDVSTALENARAIKTGYEIKAIENTCRISKKVFEKISLKGTEIEAKGLIEFTMHKFGAVPSFSTIVACGDNIRFPHHIPTGKKISGTVLVDFGLRCNGYVSDVTRTAGSRYENVIEKVLGDLYSFMEPGMKASDADNFVRKALGKYSKHFITSLGHGIGIAVHEKPWLRKTSDDVINPGMTFTIEPGIYVKDGIRTENDFLMTENGIKNLTDF